jgi:hypothetical protein
MGFTLLGLVTLTIALLASSLSEVSALAQAPEPPALIFIGFAVIVTSSLVRRMSNRKTEVVASGGLEIWPAHQNVDVEI